jgi:hypothetical protein
VSIDNRPAAGKDIHDEFASSTLEFPSYENRERFWLPEQWLELYLKEGLRIIPLYGAHEPDGTYNSKKPGYPKWQKFIPSRDELLTAIYEKQKMWGCVCGSVSGNLLIVDYDLYKILDSKEKALQWRKENIGLLRSLDTLVTFTPRGGFHVWLRTRRPGLQTRAISRVVEAIPWDIDLVRGDGGMVVVPPSKLKDVGNYWFLDDSKIRRDQKLGIRVIGPG